METTPQGDPFAGSALPTLAYFSALGKFISIFAHLEKMAFMFLGRVVGVHYHVAQATFGGSPRVKDCVDRINRCLTLYCLTPDVPQHILNLKKDWDQLHPQIGTINTTRNEILHYGYQKDESGNQFVTNEHLQYIESKVTRFPISADRLDAMCGDLSKILFLLNHHFYYLNQKTPPYQPSIYEEAINTPWQYKHGVLNPQPNKSPKKTQKQPRRPRS